MPAGCRVLLNVVLDYAGGRCDMNTNALLTDLYLLGAANTLFQLNQHQQPSIFYLFTRRAPFKGNYTIAYGIDDLLDYLANWRFSQSDCDFLSTLRMPTGRPRFSDGFLNYLSDMRFNGDVYALRDGSVVYPNSPIVRIEAPLILGQMLETIAINAINFPSLIATKASRIKAAAGDDLVAEFGLRRAQGLEAGLLASRSAYVGGVDCVANVLAGQRYGIPLVGTISHSFILSFDTEEAAFDAAANAMGDATVLLVDTFCSQRGVARAIVTAQKMKRQGYRLDAIRLDSGDLCALSQMARQMLDQADLSDVDIIASGDLDEYRIADLKGGGACIDRWGVGTRLVTAYDQPALDITYKLAAVKNCEGKWCSRMKFSDTPEKKTLPGRIQLRRYYQADQAHSDLIYDQWHPLDNRLPKGADRYEDLLEKQVGEGKRLKPAQKIADVRQFSQRSQLMHQLNDYLVDLDPAITSAQNHIR